MSDLEQQQEGPWDTVIRWQNSARPLEAEAVADALLSISKAQVMLADAVRVLLETTLPLGHQQKHDLAKRAADDILVETQKVARIAAFLKRQPTR